MKSKKYFPFIPGLSAYGFYFFLFVLLLNPGIGWAQMEVELEVRVVQDANQIRIHLKGLAYGEDDTERPAEGALVYVINTDGESEQPLDSVRLDAKGKGQVFLSKDHEFLRDEEGNILFRILSAEDEKYLEAEYYDLIPLRLARLEIAFEEVDSVKKILVSGVETDADGNEVPIDGYDVNLYTPRSFSLLKIGEAYLDVGSGPADFPTALPGDSTGNLRVIAMIEDDFTYTTVRAEASKDWAKVREPVIVEPRRGLGDTDAPLWMVYTLIVLLSVVWFHYIYVVIALFRLKQAA